MERLIQNSSFSKVAEIELTYRAKVKPSQRPQVTSSTDCYNVLKASWYTGKIGFVEQFKVMLLNRVNKVLGIYEASTGGVVVADPKLIFVVALKACASSIVLCHTHSSGTSRQARLTCN
nr:JAB domain-containing protein [Pontibacter diazotrophicus]